MYVPNDGQCLRDHQQCEVLMFRLLVVRSDYDEVRRQGRSVTSRRDRDRDSVLKWDLKATQQSIISSATLIMKDSVIRALTVHADPPGRMFCRRRLPANSSPIGSAESQITRPRY